MRIWFLLGLIPLLSWASPYRTEQVTAELVTEKSHVRPGATAWVGLRLETEPHWHTYWRFPGDTGLETKVAWELPEGWEISEPHWQVPSRIVLPSLVNFGYEGTSLIGYELRVPEGAKGSVTLKAKASWLVCKEECIPQSAKLELAVKVDGAAPKEGPLRLLFAQMKEQQPQPMPTPISLRMEEKRIGIVLEKFPGWTGDVDFFPLLPQVVTGKAPPVWTTEGKSKVAWLEKASPFFPDAPAVRGIFVVKKGKDAESFDVNAQLPKVAAVAMAQRVAPEVEGMEETPPTLLTALFFAFLGGLLLNLMPCVFPVLGIKVMALVSQGQGDRWHTRVHAKVYTFGVLVSFWVLTAALLALRSAGQSVGWGFQLQQPGFVLALIFLFSFLAANLAGLLEIGGRWTGMGSGLANKEGFLGSFFTGVLAVVVATPCTAPFMGTAIGVVLGQPASAVFAVFSSLALGLAAPFLVLAYQPKLLKALPKPGAWMDTLKQFFAFPLAATVLWLFWVLGLQVGLAGLLSAATALLALFFAVWVISSFRGFAGQAVGWALVGLALVVAISSLRWKEGAASSFQQKQSASDWKPFSDKAVVDAVATRRAVFVDFTAAWCLTCQVNKKLVLERESMKEFFRLKDVALFRADWTNSDPEITKALERHGRIGVPLYLAYPAGQDKPVVLPQILTEEIVREVFP